MLLAHLMSTGWNLFDQVQKIVGEKEGILVSEIGVFVPKDSPFQKYQLCLSSEGVPSKSISVHLCICASLDVQLTVNEEPGSTPDLVCICASEDAQMHKSFIG